MKPSRFAVKAIVRNATGQCLFLSRSEVNKHYVGCWEWPGGKVDPGEDFAMAVVRETREELMSFLDCCRQPALDALKTFLAADCESTAILPCQNCQGHWYYRQRLTPPEQINQKIYELSAQAH